MPDASANTLSLNHHYVPVWYQRQFLPGGKGEFWVLDKDPLIAIRCPDGVVRQITPKRVFPCGPLRLFRQAGLYSVSLSGVRDDVIERIVFGGIDDAGARAHRMLIGWPETYGGLYTPALAAIPKEFGHPAKRMIDLVTYLDAQKARTPRGITQIKTTLFRQGLPLSQNAVITALLARRQINSTVWAEGFWEIFRADENAPGFLLSDDPVVLYNLDCFPGAPVSRFPNEPNPFWRGTRVLFPLDRSHLLVITHVEHVDDPSRRKARRHRRNARSYDQAIINFADIKNNRTIAADSVALVNWVMKARAIRFVASKEKADLYPEKLVGTPRWNEIDRLFHQEHKTYKAGSELIVKYEDESILFSNAFGERQYVPGTVVKAREAQESSGSKGRSRRQPRR